MQWVFGVLATLCASAWFFHRLEWWQATLLYVVLATAAIILRPVAWRLRQDYRDSTTRRYKGGG